MSTVSFHIPDTYKYSIYVYYEVEGNPLTTTQSKPLLLWNHHFLWGIIVRGFRWLLLIINLHPNDILKNNCFVMQQSN